MAERAKSETLKPSFGIAALWEKVAKALLVSATAVLEWAEWSFSASVVAEQLGESGTEVMSSSLLYRILIVSGMDIQLSGEKQNNWKFLEGVELKFSTATRQIPSYYNPVDETVCYQISIFLIKHAGTLNRKQITGK